ncbi:TPA: hypothetical protein HA361_02520 [Candidatus Woesearchaeota archaeon]|nr:hypothetical protein [Candidatus Woesearchaeota archaeon]
MTTISKTPLTQSVPPAKRLYLPDGESIASIHGLIAALQKMTQSSYAGYSRGNRNRFVAWVQATFNDPELAGRLSNTTTKEELLVELQESLARSAYREIQWLYHLLPKAWKVIVYNLLNKAGKKPAGQKRREPAEEHVLLSELSRMKEEFFRLQDSIKSTRKSQEACRLKEKGELEKIKSYEAKRKQKAGKLRRLAQEEHLFREKKQRLWRGEAAVKKAKASLAQKQAFLAGKEGRLRLLAQRHEKAKEAIRKEKFSIRADEHRLESRIEAAAGEEQQRKGRVAKERARQKQQERRLKKREQSLKHKEVALQGAQEVLLRKESALAHREAELREKQAKLAEEQRALILARRVFRSYNGGKGGKKI